MMIIRIITGLCFIGWTAPLVNLLFNTIKSGLSPENFLFVGFILYGGLVFGFFRAIWLPVNWKKLGIYILLCFIVIGTLGA